MTRTPRIARIARALVAAAFAFSLVGQAHDLAAHPHILLDGKLVHAGCSDDHGVDLHTTWDDPTCSEAPAEPQLDDCAWTGVRQDPTPSNPALRAPTRAARDLDAPTAESLTRAVDVTAYAPKHGPPGANAG